MKTNKYDVIIIGAGIGGLTAGAILARNGKKVLVLEKNPVVGGYAVNFRRGEFEFDASLHMMQGCNKGGITYNILTECGIDKRLELLKPDSLYHSFYPNLEIKIKQKNPRGFIENLNKLFPKEKRGIELLLKESKGILISFEEFQKCRRMSSKLLFYLDRTCLDIFNKYISDIKLISILSQLWGYFGLPPSKLSAYCLPFYLYDYLFNGGYYILGGSGAISIALKEVIIENKGSILLNKEVKKIRIIDNRAESIITESGEEFFADSIVSNVDARLTFRVLVGDKYLPNYFLENLNNMIPSISAFQIYLGLDINLYKLGFKDYEIFVNPDFDLDSHYEMFIKNKIGGAPFCITIYSNIDKKTISNNKTNITLTMLSGYDFWEDTYTKENYKNIKEKFANILIKRAERIIPNLHSYIKVIETATPITMNRYTSNYKGAIYGWAQSVFQCGIRRFFTTTPIKNLHLASAWTYPGGGISGVLHAGELAANYILKGKFYKTKSLRKNR